VLDLLGVTFIGALGALSVQGIESKKAGNHVSVILNLLHIQNFSFQIQVVFLGLSAALAMIGKTALSIFFTRKTFRFMSFRGAKLTSDLVSKVLSQKMLDIQKRSSQETLFAVTNGVQAVVIGIISTVVNLLSDFSMLIILAFGLFVVDPITALATILIFGIIGFLLYRLLQVKAQKVGREIAIRTIENDSKILEVLRTYRESVVRGRRAYYAKQIGSIQYELGGFIAENSFFPFISKYVMDSAVVVASLLLGGIVLSLNNAVHGVATLTVFLAASTRIAPAALRIQQGLINMKTATGPAVLTLNMVDELKTAKGSVDSGENIDFDHKDFIPSIELSKVSFQYPNSNNFTIANLDLEIKPGESVAFVGPSGAGKTTLVDLILGVLEPTGGEIRISGIDPTNVVEKFPGAIAYVPQDVAIINGTIQENVAMGYPARRDQSELVKNAIQIAQLNSLVESIDGGLDAQVGEFGSKISGGQRQRLGVARALFTRPKLLVMDEATSALDGKTESDLTEALKTLHGNVTVLVVAHRLTTVMHVDKVVYLESGKIKAIGSFDDVIRAVPEFKTQSQLIGIKN
jgi:ABC-type multidrug transport system fused ATPase/permease subunit